MSLLQSAHPETTTVQDSDQLRLQRYTEPQEVMPFKIYRFTVSTLRTFLNSIFAAKAGSIDQAFAAQKLTLPNGFTIETDADYLYIKKNGTVCSKVSLTAHSSADHIEL